MLLPTLSMNHWWWHFVETYVYPIPAPKPRKRTKPMQVLCVGPPRSGTESLQQALLALGYDHTYHGWDIVYEDPPIPAPGWVRLARKKWYGGDGGGGSGSGGSSSSRNGDRSHADNTKGGEVNEKEQDKQKGDGQGHEGGSGDGDCAISATEFDELIGHCVAVTDAAASCFAAEMIRAYPEAKVVLNVRRDLDAWHRSAVKTLVHVNESWSFWVAGLLDREAFWAWHVYERFLWALFFRAPDRDVAGAIRRNGKWVYREHCDMIRGLVPKERLLEWSVDEGWEPLCRFLGKEVPDAPFPHVNAVGPGGGWRAREDMSVERWVRGALTRLVWACLVLGLGAVCVVGGRGWFWW